MVDPRLWNVVEVFAHNKFFFCVFNAGACVISTRYDNLIQSPSDPLDSGSVDVMLNFDELDGEPMVFPGGGLRPNVDGISFNSCLFQSREPGLEAENDAFAHYALMVHEAGHALGLSGFSWRNPGGHSVAHPSLFPSVMNDDGKTLHSEPDCAPHPLDVVAIRALYQTLVP